MPRSSLSPSKFPTYNKDYEAYMVWKAMKELVSIVEKENFWYKGTRKKTTKYDHSCVIIKLILHLSFLKIRDF